MSPWNDGDLATPKNLNHVGNAPVYNVKEFGAVGDDSTDDTSAIQDALDSAGNNGIVYFPLPDTAYKITSALTVSGEGKALVTEAPTWRNTGEGVEVHQTNSKKIFDVDIGGGAEQLIVRGRFLLRGGTKALHIRNGTLVRGSLVEGITATNQSTNGIHLDDIAAINTNWQSIHVDNPGGTNTDIGILVEQGSTASSIRRSSWTDVRVKGSDSWGIRLDAGSSQNQIDCGTWRDVVVEECDGGGIQHKSAHASYFGLHNENNGKSKDRADLDLRKGGSGSAIGASAYIVDWFFNSGGSSQTDRVNASKEARLTARRVRGETGGSDTWEFNDTSDQLILEIARKPPTLNGLSGITGLSIDHTNDEVRMFGGGGARPFILDGDADGVFSLRVAGDGSLRFKDENADSDIFQITENGILQFPEETDSSRPSAGTAGRVFFNSDDGQLNIDDGTNWTLPDGTTT